MNPKIRKLPKQPQKQQFGFSPNLAYASQLQTQSEPHPVYNQQSQTSQEDEKKKKKKLKWWMLLILLLLLLLLLTRCQDGGLPSIPGINMNSKLGELAAKEKQELDAGSVTFSMNKQLIFEDGKSEGNLSIYNDASSKNPQLVEIYIEDGTLIYSGGVDIGHSIYKDKLLVELPKGEYNCTVHFTSFDPITYEKNGQTYAVRLILTIEN